MLAQTAEFLNKHDVRWSICCGTLLGYMRTGHSFGIPWDDDMDIRVHRDDWAMMQVSVGPPPILPPCGTRRI